MAHTLSAKKRIRQNLAHRAVNRWRLRAMRDAIKNFRDRIVHGTADEATEQFRLASRIIDRTAQKGVIHKNQAANRKSAMAKRVTTAA